MRAICIPLFLFLLLESSALAQGRKFHSPDANMGAMGEFWIRSPGNEPGAAEIRWLPLNTLSVITAPMPFTYAGGILPLLPEHALASGRTDCRRRPESA